MKNFKRILIFILSFSLIFIAKELAELIQFAFSLHKYFGWFSVAIIAFAMVYFVVIPLIKIILIPKNLGPAENKHDVNELMKMRIDRFSKLAHTNDSIVNKDHYTEENYNLLVSRLLNETDRIKRKYISNVFYSTAVSQNGFLDALFILSNGFKMVKEIFLIFNGRVNNRDLLKILKSIYLSMLIGGSEGVEYASEEIFRKLAFDGLNKIPFADKIFSSITDGFVNASLITRVAIITENYCTMLYIKSPRDLNPTVKAINNSTKIILNDIIEKVKKALVKITKDKTSKLLNDGFSMVSNPVKYVLDFNKDKTLDPIEEKKSEGIFGRLFNK